MVLSQELYPSVLLSGMYIAIIINSVLTVLRLNLFAFSHLQILVNAGNNSMSNSPILLKDLNKLVSSANIVIFAFSTESGKSLIYIRNSKGPRIEP